MSNARERRSADIQNMASVSELRSKLWSNGYKLSSNKVAEFLRYLVHQDMVILEDNDTNDDATERTEDGIGIDGKRAFADSPPYTHKCGLPHNAGGQEDLEALVSALEQNIQHLETKIMEFTGPAWDESCAATHEMDMYHRSEDDTENDGTALKSDDLPPAKDSRDVIQQTRRKKPHKSDPVRMFHKMQTIWSKNNTNKNFR